MSALQILHRDPGSQARAGIVRTRHGDVRTPAFVPLATKGTVKGLEPREVAALGYDMVLGNTFHLFLERFTPEELEMLGTAWDRVLEGAGWGCCKI
jgi:tRNA-guanine family transglycosylase